MKAEKLLARQEYPGDVAIDCGIAVKQMDEGAVDAFMLTGMGVTSLKAVK